MSKFNKFSFALVITGCLMFAKNILTKFSFALVITGCLMFAKNILTMNCSKQLEVSKSYKDIYNIEIQKILSKKSIDKNDLYAIQKSLYGKSLKVDELKHLIVLGLQKYADYNDSIKDNLIAKAVLYEIITLDIEKIDKELINIVKLLVSIGVEINANVFKNIDKTIKNLNKSGTFAPRDKKKIEHGLKIINEVKKFLLEVIHERKNLPEKERFGQKLLEKINPKKTTNIATQPVQPDATIKFKN